MTGWLPDGTTAWGGRPVARAVADAASRGRVVLAGTVRSVTVHRRQAPHGMVGAVGSVGHSPTLDVTLDDGTGTITVRWAGRDRLPGVVPGAVLCVEGTACDVGGRLMVLNPLYRFEAAPRPAPPTDT